MKVRLVLFLCTIAAYANIALAEPAALPANAETNAPKVVAVLDFKDLGPSVELEPLRKALARMLTTDLASYGQISVVTRERVERIIKETNLGESGLVSQETAQKAGQALEADYLVQGTFSGSAEGIKVHLEVLDIAQGQPIGAAEAMGKAEEVLAVEQKLLAETVGILKLGKPAAPVVQQKAQEQTTIAVLYLQNLSPDAKLDPLQIGLTDMLIVQLQDRPGIAVVEREQLNKVLDELGLQKSALADNTQAAKIGQMLGAQVMLFGSFLVVKDSIRFDAHLVAADTGMLMQAVSARGDANDLDPVIRGLADKVAAALTAKAKAAVTAEREGKTSMEAMLHYSRGASLMQDRRYLDAVKEYEQCLYLDPDNPMALMDLAMAYQGVGATEKSLETRERLISLGEPWLSSQCNMLANDYDLLGQTDKALAIAKRGFDAYEKNRNAHPWYLETILLEEMAKINLHACDREREKRLRQVELNRQKGNGEKELLPTEEELRLYKEGRRLYLEAIERSIGKPNNLDLLTCYRQNLADYSAKYDRETAVQQLALLVQDARQCDSRIRKHIYSLALDSITSSCIKAKDFELAKQILGGIIRQDPEALEAGLAQYILAFVASETGHDREAADLYVEMADKWWPRLEQAKYAMQKAIELFQTKLNDPKQASDLNRKTYLRFGKYDMDADKIDPVTLDGFILANKMTPLCGNGEPRPVLLRGNVEGHGTSLRTELIESGKLAHACWISFDPISLSDYSVLVMDEAAFPLDSSSVEVLRGFVACGGGLLLSGVENIEGCLPYMQLLSVFGIASQRDSEQIDLAEPKTTILNHQRTTLTNTITPYIFKGRSLIVAPEIVAATYDGKPVVAAFNYGLGRVVLSGIAMWQLFSNFKKGEWTDANWSFLVQAVAWLQAEDQKNPIRDAFDAAQRRLAVEDIGGAIVGLRKIAVDNPGTRWDEEAHLLIADLFKSKKDEAAATDEYQKLAAYAKEPQIKALARLNLVRFLAAGGKPAAAKALAECWKIWQDDHANPWAATAMLEGVKWAYLASDFEAAQKAADAVMNASPESYDKLYAMVWAALCREKRGNLAEAVRIYRVIKDAFPPLISVQIPEIDLSTNARDFADRRIKELTP